MLMVGRSRTQAIMNPGPTVDVTVDSLAAGGEGVARDGGGRVTFIPGTTPGDRVKVRVVKTTSTYGRAEGDPVWTPARRLLQHRVDGLLDL